MQIEKPRFFGSLESYEKYAGRNGFFLQFTEGRRTIYGTIAGKSYRLFWDTEQDYTRLDDGAAEVVIRPSDNALLASSLKPGVATPHILDMLPYYQLKFLMKAVSNPRRAHYANVAALTGAHIAKKGAVQR